MNCIKCGKKLQSHTVFCDECLALTKDYPVDPETPVILPKVTETTAGKKRQTRKRPAPSPEEQLPKLRKTIRRLVLLVLLLFVLLSASIWLIWSLLRQEDNVRAKLPALYSWQTDTAENVSRETFSDLGF